MDALVSSSRIIKFSFSNCSGVLQAFKSRSKLIRFAKFAKLDKFPLGSNLFSPSVGSFFVKITGVGKVKIDKKLNISKLSLSWSLRASAISCNFNK